MSSQGPVSRQTLGDRLEVAVHKLGLKLGSSSEAKLIEYLFELEKWNRTYNLTSVRLVEDMLVQHVFDCLAIVPALNTYEVTHGLSFNLISDIGSGAGLPAVVLAIARPQTKVISIDAVEKKTAFVQNVANKLSLVNLQARHDRVEKISNIESDLVVSRAFSSLENFVRLAKNLTKETGVMAAMKSVQLEAEIATLGKDRDGWQVHQVDEIVVPQMQAKRYLAWMRRKKND